VTGIDGRIATGTERSPCAARSWQDGGVPLLRAVVVVILTTLATATTAHAGKPRWQTMRLPPAMPSADDRGNAEVAGARIFYAVYGKGDPVILLHGGLGNSEHFGFQLPALVDRFQVITIDSRGQGRSTNDTTTITYDVMATDVIAVMDKLAIKRASIVGWSDGGEIALKLGIAFPDRVDRLFVFGASYETQSTRRRGSPSATFALYSSKCRSDYERMSISGRPYNALVRDLLPLWRGPSGITKDQLRGIKAPVMIADGDHDEVIVLEQVIEMAKLIPNAQLRVFGDTSHFALWQDPENFNKAVVDFLTMSSPLVRTERAP
jgi:pimeloyl-ACP methyl ester carboxylesterase